MNTKPKFSVSLDYDELDLICSLVDIESNLSSNDTSRTVMLENLFKKLDSILIAYDDDDVIIDEVVNNAPDNILIFGEL